MFSDLNFNYQIQRKASAGLPCAANQQSFIKIQNVGDVAQKWDSSSPNGIGVDLKSPFSIAQALNQGHTIDITAIDQSITQVQSDLSQNLILIKVLENAKNQMLQNELSRFPSCVNSSMMAARASNIFAPKPMHAKIETSRIGRSHSMYVTNPLKTVYSSGDKSLKSEEKPSDEASQPSSKVEMSEASNRKRMNVFRCPHKDRKHYAKNMCNNCYHKQGRNKKATVCPHKDRQNYAKGKCQNWYLNDYHKNKRRMKKEEEALKADEDEVDRRISVETSNTDSNQELKSKETVSKPK